MTQNRTQSLAVLTMALLVTGIQAAGAEELTQKWFPGHYLKIRHYDGPIQENARNLVKDNPYFLGYKIHVVWNELEPEKDQYDFTVIKAALKVAGDDGKKLMIHFQDRVFNVGSQ